MKISELPDGTIYAHCGVSDPDEDSKALIEVYKTATVVMLSSFTGLTREELDELEDMTVAYLCIISEMYEKRTMTVSRESLNPTAQTIISLHDRNLLA